MFVVPVTSVLVEYPTTKRNVLKKIASVFELLGLASPFIVRAKIMLQDPWTRGYDCDEEVQNEVANRIQDTVAMPRKGQSSLLLEKSTASEVQTSSDLC